MSNIQEKISQDIILENLKDIVKCMSLLKVKGDADL
jgi:hypothetical protein